MFFLLPPGEGPAPAKAGVSARSAHSLPLTCQMAARLLRGLTPMKQKLCWCGLTWDGDRMCFSLTESVPKPAESSPALPDTVPPA